jgi:hypothetical protein
MIENKWSGRRDSNPRRPAWEIDRRLKIQILASTASTGGDRNTPSFNDLLQGFCNWSKNGAKEEQHHGLVMAELSDQLERDQRTEESSSRFPDDCDGLGLFEPVGQIAAPAESRTPTWHRASWLTENANGSGRQRELRSTGKRRRR